MDGEDGKDVEMTALRAMSEGSRDRRRGMDRTLGIRPNRAPWYQRLVAQALVVQLAIVAIVDGQTLKELQTAEAREGGSEVGS